MKVLIINKKKYKLPTKLNELNFVTGNSLDEILIDFKNDINNIECQKHLLAKLLNTNYDVINQIKDSNITSIIKNHIFFKDNLLPLYQFIQYKSQLLHYINIDDITVEKYGDIEIAIENKDYEEIFKNLYFKEKLPLIKKFLFKIFLKNNNKGVDNINYYIIKAAVSNYLEEINKLLKIYGLAENENIPIDQLNNEDNVNEDNNNPLDSFGIYHVLMNITDNNIKEVDYLMQKNLKVLLKYLFYLKIKNSKKVTNE